MKSVMYTEIEYPELDDLVKKAFPNSNFEFIVDYEANNDSSYTFFTKEGDSLNDETVPQKLEEGKSLLYRVSDVILLLCQRGLIPFGNILVIVCW